MPYGEITTQTTTADIGSAVETEAVIDASAGSDLDGSSASLLTRFIARLGLCRLAAGDTVTSTTRVLDRVSRAYGVKDNTVFTMPTGVLATLRDGERTTMEMSAGLPDLRLDQTAAVFELSEEATQGAVPPADGLRRLDEIIASKPRFGPWPTVLGHALITVGFALMLQPSWTGMGIAVALGLVVGALRLLALRWRTLEFVLPVLVSFLCAAVVFLLVRLGLQIDPLRTLVPPLVISLPGGALTTATLEIADAQIVSGATRLVYAIVQIVMLGFGIIMATQVVHLPSDIAFVNAPENSMGWWAPWIGPLAFSIGMFFHLSAPRGSLLWLTLVCYVAWTGQYLGGLLGGAFLGAFVGAIAMTPVAWWASLRPGAPPVMVTFLPAFWVLVPGSLSLLGFTEMVGSGYSQSGIEDFGTAVFVVVAIAFGIMIGVRACSWVALRLHRPEPMEL